jgi:hypothetical protein
MKSEFFTKQYDAKAAFFHLRLKSFKFFRKLKKKRENFQLVTGDDFTFNDYLHYFAQDPFSPFSVHLK